MLGRSLFDIVWWGARERESVWGGLSFGVLVSSWDWDMYSTWWARWSIRMGICHQDFGELLDRVRN